MLIQWPFCCQSLNWSCSKLGIYLLFCLTMGHPHRLLYSSELINLFDVLLQIEILREDVYGEFSEGYFKDSKLAH